MKLISLNTDDENMHPFSWQFENVTFLIREDEKTEVLKSHSEKLQSMIEALEKSHEVKEHELKDDEIKE